MAYCHFRLTTATYSSLFSGAAVPVWPQQASQNRTSSRCQLIWRFGGNAGNLKNSARPRQYSSPTGEKLPMSGAVCSHFGFKAGERVIIRYVSGKPLTAGGPYG